MVTAKTISRVLNLPLGVIITRKIGAPSQPELAIGAVGPNGTVVLDEDLISQLGVGDEWLRNEIKQDLGI